MRLFQKIIKIFRYTKNKLNGEKYDFKKNWD